MYGPELEIGTPVFTDDIMAVGKQRNKNWNKKLCSNGKKKKLNLEKTKYMVIRTGDKMKKKLMRVLKWDRCKVQTSISTWV